MVRCCSRSAEEAEARKNSKKIDAQLKRERKDKPFLKLLMLGTGESGKSTIIKQFRLLHDSGFPEEYCKQMRPPILNSLMTTVRTIHQAVVGERKLKPELEVSVAEREEWEAIVDSLQEFPAIVDVSTHVPPQFVKPLSAFWAHPITQRAWSRRHEIPLLPECSRPFFTDVARILAPDYVPSTQDVLYARVMTTGVSQYSFKIGRDVWNFYDVGGQRSERRKWAAYFDDCAAIVYVVDASGFNTVLFEDGVTNRMVEAQNAFKAVASNPLLKHIPIVLFFNKIDLVKEKLANGYRPKDFLPDYNGEDTYLGYIAWCEKRFTELNPHADRTIYSYSTWATDTNQVRTVLATCREVFQELALKRAGFT